MIDDRATVGGGQGRVDPMRGHARRQVDSIERVWNCADEATGRTVDPHHLWFVPEHVERIKDVAAETVRAIEDVVEAQYAAIYRDHPFLEPSDQVNWLRRMLEDQEVRAALHLNS